jgi:hypothetical protein
VFDGIDDNVSIPNSTLTQFPVNSSWSFTISSEMISLNTTYPSILSKGNSGPGGSGILVFYTSGGYIYFKHNNSSSTAVIALMNAPFQYTVTYSGGAVKIYLNGSYRNNGPTIVSADTTSNLLLAAGDSFSNIKVYDFMKYNRQLSDQEILQNYQAMLPRFLNKNIVTNGLIEYLDAGYLGSYPTSGNTWYNVAGVSGGTGTLTNGPTYSTSGGGSIVFDGVDDVVNGTIDGSIFTGDFTQTAWVYKLNNNQIWQGVFTNSSPATNNTYLMTFGNGSAQAPFNSVGTNQVGVLQSGIFLDVGSHLNRWLYLGITKKGNVLTIYCYKDGTLLTNTGIIDWNGGNFNTTNNYQIGRHWAGGSVIPFQGNISNISIYNRELTQAEITQNYNAQKSRFGL